MPKSTFHYITSMNSETLRDGQEEETREPRDVLSTDLSLRCICSH